MKKNLLLYILLGFLVIMNCFFLFKHFDTSNQKGTRGPGPSNFITKQLDFNPAQLKQFEKLEVEHREKIDAILNEIRSSKSALFDKLSDETVADSEIDAITTLIGNKEKAKELETFRFFTAVGAICNESQKLRFNTIIKDAIREQRPPGRNGPRPRGPREEGRPPPPGGPGGEGRPPRPKY